MKAIDLIEVIIDFNRADFDNSIRSPTHTGGFGIEEDSSFAVGSSGVFKTMRNCLLYIDPYVFLWFLLFCEFFN